MEGREIADKVRRKAEEFRKFCAGIDEGTASRAPEGRWSPKQIVSHLCGLGGLEPMAVLRLFVEKDVPEIDLEPGNPCFSGKRAQMTFAELVAEFERTYRECADFIARLTPAELGRKAHIPALKESPLGEYPTLGALFEGRAPHIAFHIDHMREILAAQVRTG